MSHLVGATLFSGIGAPETAMPGWRWPWHAEIEKFPSAVLATRHAGSTNLGDVSADDFTQRAAEIARPDVLVFGSPCQSYSIAGKRLGLDDPRGNLALVALGIVARLAPRWFVFENVPGLLSSSEGRDFGIFLRTVDELGYSGAWASLDAQWFGVAQRRERVFFVGHSGDWRCSAAILLEPESLCGNHPPRREARERVAGTIEASLGRSRGAGTPTNAIALGSHAGAADADQSNRSHAGGGPVGSGISEELSYSLRAGRTQAIATATVVDHALNAHGGSGRIDYESETFVTHPLRADGFDAGEDGTGRGTPLVPVAYRTSGNEGVYSTGDRIDALTTGTDPNSHLIAFDLRNAAAGPVTQTLQAAGIGSERGGNPNAIPHTMSGSAVRRLTPRECERLQGFPDDFTNVTYRGKPAADGPRYKALGNSMAVPVMRWILSRIELMDISMARSVETAGASARGRG